MAPFATAGTLHAPLPDAASAANSYWGPLTPSNLNNHHHNTLEAIFSHPASGNIEWRQVVSLLEAVGTVTEEHNGKLKITLGPETETLRASHGKDIDQQLIVDLRRMLRGAGYEPADGSTTA